MRDKFRIYAFSKFGKKKKVMNVFEIGSDLENIVLINTILNNENFEYTSLLIILDFDNPNTQLNQQYHF